MVAITSLWLPILVSALFVFIASSIIHVLLGYHQSDFKKIPNEEGVMAALREFNIPPGNYFFPRAESMKEMNTEEHKEKIKAGPPAMMTVYDSKDVLSMNKSLVLWFVFCIVTSLFAAYLTSRAIGEGGTYLDVFRFAGTTAFIAYTMALWHQHIWYKTSFSGTLKSTFDGLIYGLLTGGVFGWLWPF